ncbi:hypothetical protein GLA29479_2579 [Lysobacter antibioticus]|uniref:Uncharacterized protein n=1 Tax=Lysobacter antibioticus TaxID=84531 RepID=A0A0S2FGH5_LYSAN|nr:hypothetical protein GLA29479_2579 [Lysobacter antibioticus]ALN82638.1 hypothetical protein LA76x_4530 [Lysobacter antibioticus]
MEGSALESAMTTRLQEHGRGLRRSYPGTARLGRRRRSR